MAYNGKLNYIEKYISWNVKTWYSPTNTKNWRGTVTYNTKNKTGNYILYKTTKRVDGNTKKGSTKVTLTENRQYSAKYKSGGTKKKPKYSQRYRSQFQLKVEAFLSTLDAAKIKDAGVTYDPYKYVLRCKGYTGINATLGEIPPPSTVKIAYEDVDVETVDKQLQVSSLSRNTSGYVTRNRKRANIATLSLTWSRLTASEVKKIIDVVSASELVRVGYFDPLQNANIAKTMFTSTRSVDYSYGDRFKDLTIDLIEI